MESPLSPTNPRPVDLIIPNVVTHVSVLVPDKDNGDNGFPRLLRLFN